MLETWVESKDKNEYFKFFNEYGLHWEFAIRDNLFGRAKGGILVGIRKSIKDNVLVKNEVPFFDILIQTKFESVRLIPAYLSFSNWMANFNELQNYIEGKYSERIILVGDLNGRIGIMQDIDNDMVKGIEGLGKYRNSEDHVSNANGNKLL